MAAATRAAVFHHPKKVTVDTLPDPKLENATDCLLKVTSTAICGSDLHIYNGLFPKLDDVISHRVPLAKAGDAYEVFNAKKDGCTKVVLKP